MIAQLLKFPLLVRSSGLSENALSKKLLSEESDLFPEIFELIDALRSNPDLVEEWLSYSADRRASQSYYFRKNEGTYDVGYVSHSEAVKIGTYECPFFACALFMKLEFEKRFLKLMLARGAVKANGTVKANSPD